MEREDYLNERKLLIREEQGQYSSFDKYILTLASGALGLSLTFIKDIVPGAKYTAVACLISAWVFFCMSIISTLTSFMVSQSAYSKQRDILDQQYSGEQANSDTPKNTLAAWVRRLNICSMTTFLVGVILLIIFVSVNLTNKEVAMSDDRGKQAGNPNVSQAKQSAEPKKIEKGSVPPNPPVVLKDIKEAKTFGSIPPTPPKPKDNK